MFETGRAQSELFAFQFGQWELIGNSQLIGRYKEMSPGESYDIPPQFETGRAQSELCTFQCSQWELIWSSQLIGRYKEMSPGESYNIPPHYNTARTTTVNFSHISALPNTADWPHTPPLQHWQDNYS